MVSPPPFASSTILPSSCLIYALPVSKELVWSLVSRLSARLTSAWSKCGNPCGPSNAETIERSLLNLNLALLVFVASTGELVNVLHSQELPAALICLIQTASFFPQLPASCGFRSLLLIFKRNSNKRPISVQLRADNRTIGVFHYEFVGLAP